MRKSSRIRSNSASREHISPSRTSIGSSAKPRSVARQQELDRIRQRVQNSRAGSEVGTAASIHTSAHHIEYAPRISTSDAPKSFKSLKSPVNEVSKIDIVTDSSNTIIKSTVYQQKPSNNDDTEGLVKDIMDRLQSLRVARENDRILLQKLEGKVGRTLQKLDRNSPNYSHKLQSSQSGESSDAQISTSRTTIQQQQNQPESTVNIITNTTTVPIFSHTSPYKKEVIITTQQPSTPTLQKQPSSRPSLSNVDPAHQPPPFSPVGSSWNTPKGILATRRVLTTSNRSAHTPSISSHSETPMNLSSSLRNMRSANSFKEQNSHTFALPSTSDPEVQNMRSIPPPIILHEDESTQIGLQICSPREQQDSSISYIIQSPRVSIFTCPPTTSLIPPSTPLPLNHGVPCPMCGTMSQKLAENPELLAMSERVMKQLANAIDTTNSNKSVSMINHQPINSDIVVERAANLSDVSLSQQNGTPATPGSHVTPSIPPFVLLDLLSSLVDAQVSQVVETARKVTTVANLDVHATGNPSSVPTLTPRQNFMSPNSVRSPSNFIDPIFQKAQNTIASKENVVATDGLKSPSLHELYSFNEKSKERGYNEINMQQHQQLIEEINTDSDNIHNAVTIINNASPLSALVADHHNNNINNRRHSSSSPQFHRPSTPLSAQHSSKQISTITRRPRYPPFNECASPLRTPLTRASNISISKQHSFDNSGEKSIAINLSTTPVLSPSPRQNFHIEQRVTSNMSRPFSPSLALDRPFTSCGGIGSENDHYQSAVDRVTLPRVVAVSVSPTIANQQQSPSASTASKMTNVKNNNHSAHVNISSTGQVKTPRGTFVSHPPPPMASPIKPASPSPSARPLSTRRLQVSARRRGIVVDIDPGARGIDGYNYNNSVRSVSSHSAATTTVAINNWQNSNNNNNSNVGRLPRAQTSNPSPVHSASNIQHRLQNKYHNNNFRFSVNKNTSSFTSAAHQIEISTHNKVPNEYVASPTLNSLQAQVESAVEHVNRILTSPLITRHSVNRQQPRRMNAHILNAAAAIPHPSTLVARSSSQRQQVISPQQPQDIPTRPRSTSQMQQMIIPQKVTGTLNQSSLVEYNIHQHHLKDKQNNSLQFAENNNSFQVVTSTGGATGKFAMESEVFEFDDDVLEHFPEGQVASVQQSKFNNELIGQSTSFEIKKSSPPLRSSRMAITIAK